jgi:hypothetical protein
LVLALRKECVLKGYKNKILRSMFGPKIEDIMGGKEE